MGRRRCFKKIKKKFYRRYRRSSSRNAVIKKNFLSTYKNYIKQKHKGAVSVAINNRVQVKEQPSFYSVKHFISRVHKPGKPVFFTVKKTFFKQKQKNKQQHKIKKVQKSFTSFACKRKYFRQYINSFVVDIVDNIEVTSKNKTFSNVINAFSTVEGNALSLPKSRNIAEEEKTHESARKAKNKPKLESKDFAFSIKNFNQERLQQFIIGGMQFRHNLQEQKNTNFKKIKKTNKTITQSQSKLASTEIEIKLESLKLSYLKLHRLQKLILFRRLRKRFRPRVPSYSKGQKEKRNKYRRFYQRDLRY